MTDALADHLREHRRVAWDDPGVDISRCPPPTREDFEASERLREAMDLSVVVTDMVRIERGQHLAVCGSCQRRGVYLRDGEPRCRYCGERGLT